MAESEAGGGSRSLEYTPTWIVAVICSIIVLISLLAERGLHLLGKWLKRSHQDALYEALQKLQEELMLLGFISLLLTVSQRTISKICIPSHLANYMLPCKRKEEKETTHHLIFNFGRHLLSEEDPGTNHCTAKGKVQLVSLEGLHQLHIFVFVLAVVHVIFCATTMVLGVAKIREWEHWEHSINRLNGPAKNGHGHNYRQFFAQRTIGHYRKLPVVRWILLLLVGAHLEHIITRLARDVAEKSGDAVKPTDDHFWCNSPKIIIYLIHFILFQNSFEIGFFFWVWTTYGFDSCVMEKVGYIVTKLVLGAIVQVLCSYSTLPLYALVSQMGSMFKRSIFNQLQLDLISDWVGERGRPDSSLAGSSHPHRLENQPRLNDETITIDQGTTTSTIELSSPVLIPEQV
ncbi:Mlo-related protein [Cynara cardunculus var. scolymus]|uniref:MLO-like protein n=1 Tax=Cynara cardunculus var. scolymus TaxID=59895 RepID=A0A103TG03_CYNCS|nr:Mlo-related protein [Cynara cardunculus var. scolymus]